MKIVLRQTPRTIDRLFGSGGAMETTEFADKVWDCIMMYFRMVAMLCTL